MRVLVAEDDTALRSVLERGLRENGYVVDSVGDGSAALRHLRAYEYDVAVLDWRMPEHTGIEVVEEVRRAGDRTPILMLTAKALEAEKVLGLELGADDYVTKPFSPRELVLRVQAILRRGGMAAEQGVSSYGAGVLVIDQPRRPARRGAGWPARAAPVPWG